MKPLVAHLDSDCFYVSCERVRDFALRHIPAGVLGNQGACVIAKSYEAKGAGIKTGMPIWEAVKLCPSAVFLKRDFRWYEILSKQLLELLRTVSPAVEYYSIDEMFFDARQLSQVFSLPLPAAAVALQQRILQELQIPVSMGIAHTKTLAKLVSDTAKPFGCRVLLETEDREKFLRSQPASEISGVGERSFAKLVAQGITTCWDYAQADRHLIRKLLTIKGEGIWWELQGEPIQPIQTTRPKHQCIGRGGSLGEATTNVARLIGWTVRNIERLIEELDFHHVLAGRLAFGVDFRDGGGWSGRGTFLEPTASFLDLTTAAKALLQEACQFGRPINRMQILAEQLSPRDRVQRSLFANAEPENRSVIARVKHDINQKLGRFAVRGGETAVLQEIYADEANEYDICDIRGKICF